MVFTDDLTQILSTRADGSDECEGVFSPPAWPLGTAAGACGRKTRFGGSSPWDLPDFQAVRLDAAAENRPAHVNAPAMA
jgi:hypothetical protein